MAGCHPPNNRVINRNGKVLRMDKISAALVKAQKAFGPALKSSTNPHFKSRYADLAACVEAVIDGLNSNDIALIQNTHECQDGVIVETMFIHSSGQMLSAGKLHVPAAKHDPQGYGSALTYARRYSLMAACGIAPEDDDGNAARKPQISLQASLAAMEASTSTDALKTAYKAAFQAHGANEQIEAMKDAMKAKLMEVK
jgi:hypothetical protein